ncbi:NUDIX domain-containing protein [Alcaligenes sp. SDU_A2]|uniref:NUDIX hydrolase n=1 Tax=Alcaligenes sp. SDU_A2 TaxID=3136634 RepID=UPI002BE68D2E|nr:NUDIX domain-containing protein [Alcaligenes sp.]HRL27030.1 NUDIX domain-containing protein [Alcaligenes sp.]
MASLTSQIQQLPPPGSRPVTVSGRVAGWITARAAACIEALPGVRIDEDVLRINACPQQGLTLEQVLDQIAVCLQQGGCIRAWRDELLAVQGEGVCLSRIERGAVRPLGFLTQAVHLNAWSDDGRIWAARRSPTKSTDPNMWDTLVGGLAVAGETLETSLVRESYEEAGLAEQVLRDCTPLRVVLRMHRRLPEGYQVENALVSDCVLPDDVRPCNMDGEVSEFRLLTVDEAWQMMEAELFTLEAQVALMDSFQQRLAQSA